MKINQDKLGLSDITHKMSIESGKFGVFFWANLPSPKGNHWFFTSFCVFSLLGGELPTARKWVITPVIYMG